MKKTGRINFRAAIITVLCTLLDLTGRYFAVRYKLPLWGDSLGTALACAWTILRSSGRRPRLHYAFLC